MPLTESNLVRNGFFTYYVAMKDSGAVTAETRKLDQIFNHDGITVQVNGTYIRKGGNAINVFGKKHILATRPGGKLADDKAGSIHTKRLDPMLVLKSRNAKAKALQAASGDATLKNGTQPTKDVYGSKLSAVTDKNTGIVKQPSSTFFVIDGLAPDAVRAVFTSAVKDKCTVGADTEVELVCGPGHVWQLEGGVTMDKTGYTKIKVSVFFDGAIYNVHHCGGPIA